MGSWAQFGFPLVALIFVAVGAVCAVGLILWRRR